VAKGQPLSWDDVDSDTTTDAWKVRREMETMFAG
jgi:predicted homoserine dehydrogenase-like protein